MRARPKIHTKARVHGIQLLFRVGPGRAWLHHEGIVV